MREFRSLESFAEFISKHAVENNVVLHETMGLMAHTLHKKAHDTFGDLDKLQALQESTIDQKASMGYADPSAPLIATGELRDSLEVVHEGDVAGVGTSDVKMVYHEYGTIGAGGHIPPRPVLQIAMDETKEENFKEFKAGAAEALGISLRRTRI